MAGPQISLEIAGIRKLKTDTTASSGWGFKFGSFPIILPKDSNKNKFNADYAEDCENDDGLKMNWSGGALT